MKNRWIAIRASAVLAIVGSLGVIVLAALIVFGAFLADERPQSTRPPIPLKALGAAVGIFLVGLAGWGIVTAVAMLRRRAWARLSMLVFAGLLTVMCGSGIVTILFIPLPDTAATPPDLMIIIRWAIAGSYGALMAVGVWWLILFNRPSAREYFAGGGEVEAEGARPLSISVIAWYLLTSALFTSLAAVLRFPAMLFGAVVGGWGALAVYTGYTAAQVYLGAGLLQLQNRARLWSIVYFAAAALNGLIFVILPDFTGRLKEIQSSYPRFMRAQPEMPEFTTVWPFVPMVILLVALPIWFLVRRRSAFLAA
jgi:hypothetical protein